MAVVLKVVSKTFTYLVVRLLQDDGSSILLAIAVFVGLFGLAYLFYLPYEVSMICRYIEMVDQNYYTI